MQNDAFQTSNVAATTAAFELRGGRYACSVKASNYGTVKLQMLALDKTTYLDLKQAYSDGSAGTETDLVIGTFGADGTKVFDLASGIYRLTVASCTAIYASVARIPAD